MSFDPTKLNADENKKTNSYALHPEGLFVGTIEKVEDIKKVDVNTGLTEMEYFKMNIRTEKGMLFPLFMVDFPKNPDVATSGQADLTDILWSANALPVRQGETIEGKLVGKQVSIRVYHGKNKKKNNEIEARIGDYGTLKEAKTRNGGTIVVKNTTKKVTKQNTEEDTPF